MLEVKNVSYAYKTKKDKTILNHVSATFEEGIFYTIIGPSGAGKTTLLSLLAGLDTAVRGGLSGGYGIFADYREAAFCSARSYQRGGERNL